MHSRNLRSNSSASANHIWLKALYFSRNPGKAVASTRHRKEDFHHFFQSLNIFTPFADVHLKLHLSLGRSSANCGRNAYGFCTSRRPSICVTTLFTKDCLFIWVHNIIIWFLIGVRFFLLLFSNLLFRYKECTSILPFACVCSVMWHVQTHMKIDFPNTYITPHRFSVGLPLVLNFCIKKLLSNKLAQTWVGINQGHVTAGKKQNQDFCLIPYLCTFNIQIRIRQPVLPRPCNDILMDTRLALRRRFGGSPVHRALPMSKRCQDVRTTGKSRAPLTWQLLTQSMPFKSFQHGIVWLTHTLPHPRHHVEVDRSQKLWRPTVCGLPRLWCYALELNVVFFF